jgi:hypothetical protein
MSETPRDVVVGHPDDETAEARRSDDGRRRAFPRNE